MPRQSHSPLRRISANHSLLLEGIAMASGAPPVQRRAPRISDHPGPQALERPPQISSDMAMNASGIRDTTSALPISSTTAIKELRKKSPGYNQ